MMASILSLLLGLLIIQSIHGLELTPELADNSQSEEYTSEESQVTTIPDFLLTELVDILFIQPALAQIEELTPSGYIEECVKFVRTLKTIPQVAKDVAAAIRAAAKAGAAEIKKLFKCRNFECVREMEFEIKGFVNSLPDRFKPSLHEVKAFVLTAKGELEKCLGIYNSTLPLENYTL